MTIRNILLLLLALSVSASMSAQTKVKPGIEVLRDGGFAQLQGKRVGLIPTQPASTTTSKVPSTYSMKLPA